MWCFTYIPEICVYPPNILPEYQERMKNVGLYTHPRNIYPPPNVWHEYQDRIENLGLYTHTRNMCPPKCLERISG